MAHDDGSRFLEHTKHEFLEDLAGSFGERSDAFTADLKVLLFELWVRARSRPPFPDAKPEPTDEMKQAEFEKRMSAALARVETNDNFELAQDFARFVQRTIVVGEGITREDNVNFLELALDDSSKKPMDRTQFADLLYDTLTIDGVGLETHRDTASESVRLGLDLPANAVGAAIPDIDPYDSDDKDQERLKKRLKKLGLIPPVDWLPVMQNKETGEQVAVDTTIDQMYCRRTVETLLVYDRGTLNWMFPNPRPLYTYDCTHVRLWVDGTDQANSTCTWNSVYDANLTSSVVESVNIPGVLDGSIVKASYTTMSVER